MRKGWVAPQTKWGGGATTTGQVANEPEYAVFVNRVHVAAERDRDTRASARVKKKKTCNVRWREKKKEDMKRKGKQRPVGEMAIRWIAKKKVSPAWVGSPPPHPTFAHLQNTLIRNF